MGNDGHIAQWLDGRFVDTRVARKPHAAAFYSTGVTDDEYEDFRCIFGGRGFTSYSSGKGCKTGIFSRTRRYHHINSEPAFF